MNTAVRWATGISGAESKNPDIRNLLAKVAKIVTHFSKIVTHFSHSSIAKHSLCENQEYEVLEQELLSEDLLDIIELAEIDLSLEKPHTARDCTDWSASSLQVKRRNDTRWSSGLLMATRFFQLKAPISAYIEKSTDRKVKLLALTPIFYGR